jgi:hypothetical protein
LRAGRAAARSSLRLIRIDERLLEQPQSILARRTRTASSTQARSTRPW